MVSPSAMYCTAIRGACGRFAPRVVVTHFECEYAERQRPQAGAKALAIVREADTSIIHYSFSIIH